jgi:hypothetical protein
MVDPNVSYTKVHTSRGKVMRAEPIAALYEQHRVHHVGAFPNHHCRWRGAHRQRLHQRGFVLGVEGRRGRQLRGRHPIDSTDARAGGIFRGRVHDDPRRIGLKAGWLGRRLGRTHWMGGRASGAPAVFTPAAPTRPLRRGNQGVRDVGGKFGSLNDREGGKKPVGLGVEPRREIQDVGVAAIGAVAEGQGPKAPCQAGLLSSVPRNAPVTGL